MKTRAQVVVAFSALALLVSSGCTAKKSNPAAAAARPAGPSQPAVGASGTATAVGGAAGAAAASGDKGLVGAAGGGGGGVLSDEKIAGFAVYRREMIPMNKLAMGMAVGAYANGATEGKKMAEALTADERIKKLSAASDAALEKARITMADVAALTPILTPYYVQRALSIESEQALAAIQKRKGEGKSQAADDAIAEVHQKKVAEVAALRADYEAKYGKDGIEALDRHEREFIELGKAELESVLGNK